MIKTSPDSPITRIPYFTKPLLVVLLLGFASGLPLALTASTLSAWLFEAKVDIKSISLFAAVATPYTLKFLWSPLIDSLPVPALSRLFGRRRGWLLATQVFSIAAIILLGLTDPLTHPFYTALAAVLVAFASASQDIVIDAYRVEILKPEEQGQGAAMAQLGYRFGMIASGAGALYLAEFHGWQVTYFVMAALLGIGILTTFWADEPAASREAVLANSSFAQWLQRSVIAPFADFMKHPSWLLILLFIVAYRLADAFIGSMTNPFLLDIGFTKPQIAEIVKVYGLIATLAGTFLGGWMVARYGAVRIMFVAGILHAITNLLFVVQAQIGVHLWFLGLSIAVENFTGGISAAAFVAFLSGLCNLHYTATQYALLSSFAAFGRTWLSTPAGTVKQWLGWELFFFFSALLAIPGLLMLWVLNKRLKQPTAT